MCTALNIEFPARPDSDSSWYKDTVEKEMKKRNCIQEHGTNWIHWVLTEALGDICDPKEAAPLNMLAENDLVTSLTISFADGPCKITKY